MKYENHYEWCDDNLADFFDAVGLEHYVIQGVLSAHGDKCRQYFGKAEKDGIHKFHAAAIYLLSQYAPWADETCRQADGTWVDPGDWIVANKDKFVPLMAPPGK